MIQANELRIGNLVNWNRSKESKQNEPVDVYNIYRTSLRVYTNIEEPPEELLGYDEVDPIPLTKEWLLKLGFSLDTSVGVWFGEKYENSTHYFTVWDAINDVYRYTRNEPDDNIQITSVHQLQNLYFSLTGKELEIVE